MEAYVDPQNWKHWAVMAIQRLPNDIDEVTGYSLDPRGTDITVSVACDPGPRETADTTIHKFRLRGTPAQSAIEVIAQGSPKWNPGEGEESGGLFLGCGNAIEFMRAVQVLVCDMLYEGGCGAIVSRDEAGRFRRSDGTLVLSWQRSNPEPHPGPWQD